MTEQAVIWEPTPDFWDIDRPFDSIGFTYSARAVGSSQGRTVRVTMRGARTLRLRFQDVQALRFEEECPGFDPLPRPLPALGEHVTYPVMQIKHSHWLSQWEFVLPSRPVTHFALVSLDDLVQIIAGPEVEARWM